MFIAVIGYAPLIKTYVQFILSKLRFHRLRPEFNGLFEYEEYVTLKGIDDPNEGCDICFYFTSGTESLSPQLRDNQRLDAVARPD